MRFIDRFSEFTSDLMPAKVLLSIQSARIESLKGFSDVIAARCLCARHSTAAKCDSHAIGVMLGSRSRR